MPDALPVIVFPADDPLPMAFESLDATLGYIEAIDIESGLYRGGVFALDGQIVEARVTDGVAELVPTSQRDLPELRARLAAAAERGLISADPDDPVAAARELLQQQWDSRWPKRPRWLDRRLHGDTPPAMRRPR